MELKEKEGRKMTKSKKKSTVRRPASPPKARRYVPKPCGSCEAIRPKGSSYSSVTGTNNGPAGIVRYCRCGFCGHTWTDLEKKQAS